MFFGKPRFLAYAGPAPVAPMADGLMGMAPAPGMAQAEGVHVSQTEFAQMPPGCTHYGHFEYDLEPRPQVRVHVVRAGETVYKIAQRYGLDWRELAGFNHLGNPNLIYPGQRLEIPPRVY